LFVENSISIEPIFIERLLMTSAARKNYGTKKRLAQTYSDENKLTLWCWEIEQKDQQCLYPYRDDHLSKVKS
jgi:hypothetical protein